MRCKLKNNVVLILCFVFSSVTVKCQYTTDNTMLKNHLQKSLLRVNAMLADIENKIEKERNVLSRMDDNLNYNDKAGFLDYEVTNIWWQTTTRRPTQAPTDPDNTRLKQQNDRTVNKSNSKLLRDVQKPFEISDIVAAWAQQNVPIQNSDTNETLPNPPVETIVTTAMTTATTLNTTTITEQPQPDQNTTSETISPAPPTPPGLTGGLVTFPPGVPPGWPLFTTVSTTQTQDSEFVQNLKKNMVEENHGYFTAFITKFLEIVVSKDSSTLIPALQGVEGELATMTSEGKLEPLGQDITSSIYLLIAMRGLVPLSVMKQKAAVTLYALQNKVVISNEIKELLQSSDNMYTPEEGNELFESLERFDKFPEDESENEVAKRMLKAMFAPVTRLRGTRQLRLFKSQLHEVLQEHFPHWRTEGEGMNSTVQEMISNAQGIVSNLLGINSTEQRIKPSVQGIISTVQRSNSTVQIINSTIQKPTNISKGKNRFSIIPSRRRIALPSYKKMMRHLRIKHPKLFKKYYRHNNHNKENTHHHTVHKKHHHLSNKNYRTHKKIARAYRPILRKPTPSHSRHKYQDSCGSSAYFHERIHKDNRNIEKSKDKKRHHIRPIIPSKLNSINAEYIRRQIAKHLKTKKKIKSFRKFMIEPSETETISHYQKVQIAVDKNTVHKITEASSYSDEEDNLKSNLYDAIRHGNRTFVEFRAFDNDTTDNQNIDLTRDSSSDPDDEWVLKSNIYKAFAQ